MTDLFGDAIVPGLAMTDELIDVEEEAMLVARLAQLDLAPFRFRGWEGNRRTVSFGWVYDFDRSTFSRGEAIPAWLDPVRHRAAALANVSVADLEQALIARYDAGAGIGWHRDRPQFGRVVGVSLESDAVLRLRRRRQNGSFQRAFVDLPRRSAYLLDGEVRSVWEHSIAPGTTRRFSITFRTLLPASVRRP